MILSLLGVFSVQLLLLYPSSVGAAASSSCVSNYEELKDSLRDNDTDNVQRLLDAFYPPNESTIHSVKVTYCFAFNESACSSLFNANGTSANYSTSQAVVIYQWAENALLLLLEPDLINALAFGLYDLKSTDLNLVISPFCSNDIESNYQLLNTLTSWLKSYANSDTETDQGYAIFYDPVSDQFIYDTYNINRLRLLTLTWLLFTVLVVTIIINARLCSEQIARKIENSVGKMVESAFGIASLLKALKSANWKQLDKEDEVKKFETKMEEELSSNREYKLKIKEMAENLVQITLTLENGYINVCIYILGLLVFLIWDGVAYSKATKFRIVDWYAFFPVPIVIPVFFVVSCIISSITGCVILCHSKYDRKMSKICDILKDLMPLPFLTTFILFVLFHGFWILLMGGAYPDRILSMALFLVPLYFPAKLLLEVSGPVIMKSFQRIRDWLKSRQSDRSMCNKLLMVVIAVKNHSVTIFGIMLFLSFWFLSLSVLFFASNFLLIVTDIRENPIKLFAYVTFASVVTRYLVKICKSKPEEKRSAKYEPADNSPEVSLVAHDENINDENTSHNIDKPTD